MVRSIFSVVAAGCDAATSPPRKVARELPTSRREPDDWPLDADDDGDDDDESESDPDDFADDLPLDDFELDDEPDPEPGDFWGDVDDEEF